MRTRPKNYSCGDQKVDLVKKSVEKMKKFYKYATIYDIESLAKETIEIGKDEIDPLLVFEMSKRGATLEQLSAIFRVSIDKISERYNDVIHKGQAYGNYVLTNQMYEKATTDKIEGSEQMLIWLSKNRLGFRDKPESDNKDQQIQIILKDFSEES